MNHIRRILAAAATLAGALLALAAAPAAYAELPPYGGGPASMHTAVRVVTTGGMPGWQIALIAATAALVAATVAVLTAGARVAHKEHATA
jgi:hypothetical protein